MSTVIDNAMTARNNGNCSSEAGNPVTAVVLPGLGYHTILT